jgi:hypothetical protein
VRTVTILVVLAALEAACSSGGPLKAAATNADPASAPKPFVQHIESQWKGASVTTRATAPCAATPSESETTKTDSQGAFLSGDFDGDGAKDVAAPVKRADGLHIVAGLQHTYDYTVMDVTEKPDASADRFTVRPRGARYSVPGSDVDYYFGADTIVVAPCGGAPTAYIWTGMGFDPQPLAR